MKIRDPMSLCHPVRARARQTTREVVNVWKFNIECVCVCMYTHIYIYTYQSVYIYMCTKYVFSELVDWVSACTEIATSARGE